jgi:hypothetical protein
MTVLRGPDTPRCVNPGRRADQHLQQRAERYVRHRLLLLLTAHQREHLEQLRRRHNLGSGDAEPAMPGKRLWHRRTCQLDRLSPRRAHHRRHDGTVTNCLVFDFPRPLMGPPSDGGCLEDEGGALVQAASGAPLTHRPIERRVARAVCLSSAKRCAEHSKRQSASCCTTAPRPPPLLNRLRSIGRWSGRPPSAAGGIGLSGCPGPARADH